jgi:hypothetical protein
MACAAGEQTSVILPGRLLKLDGNGNVALDVAIAPLPATGELGHPDGLSESENGDLLFHDWGWSRPEDPTTWPRPKYGRLTSFDATGKVRWTQVIEGRDYGNLPQLAADHEGRLALFGDARGFSGIPGGATFDSSSYGLGYLGIMDRDGHALVQRNLDPPTPSSGVWRGGELTLASFRLTEESKMSLSVFSASGDLTQSTTLVLVPNGFLNDESVSYGYLAAQGADLIFAGTRDTYTHIPGDALLCAQSRPYVIRINSDGSRDATFCEFLP